VEFVDTYTRLLNFAVTVCKDVENMSFSSLSSMCIALSYAALPAWQRFALSLGCHLAVCLDIDMFIGLEDRHFVIRDIRPTVMSAKSLGVAFEVAVREALDQLELTCNLATLVRDRLLCSMRT
jgi:hypothetical protein